jgi:hypothetical protein
LEIAGKIAVIEFLKHETPMGPPTARRISKGEVADVMQAVGLSVIDDYDLGANFYCMVFSREK